MNGEIMKIEEFMFRADDGSWFVKPICDFFGLDYKNQQERINKDRICQSDSGKSTCQSIFGDNRERLTLQNRGVSRWVQMINSSIIRVELQEKFEIFQAVVFDYLYKGNIQKQAQLEDLRNYSLNIMKAIKLKKQILKYVSEQNKFQKMCLANSPEEWEELKKGLIQENEIPFEELKQLNM